jgi:hypothetical protein
MKVGGLMELKKVVGSIFDKNNNFSINSVEWGRTAATATIIAPGKTYYGVNCQLLPSNNVLLSGSSTQNSPITVRLNISTATTVLYNCSLICNFDAIIEIDPANKNAVVRQ